MLRLAGCSSGTGVGARGGWRRGDVFLLRRRRGFPARRVLRLITPAVRFCWSVCVRSRLSLFLCQEKRDGLRDLAFLFRVGRDRH